MSGTQADARLRDVTGARENRSGVERHTALDRVARLVRGLANNPQRHHEEGSRCAVVAGTKPGLRFSVATRSLIQSNCALEFQGRTRKFNGREEGRAENPSRPDLRDPVGYSDASVEPTAPWVAGSSDGRGVNAPA